MNKRDRDSMARYRALGAEVAAFNQALKNGTPVTAAHPDRVIRAHCATPWRVVRAFVINDPEFGGVHLDLLPPADPLVAEMGAISRFISDEQWAIIREQAAVAAYIPKQRRARSA